MQQDQPLSSKWNRNAQAVNKGAAWTPGPLHPALREASVAKVSKRRGHGVDHTHSFMLDRWEVTNQRRTGRCWIFAATNVFRAACMSQFKEFDLSQNYLAFFDKVEKANTFLHLMLHTAQQPIESRTVQCLLGDIVEDGGQWNMVAGLVAKYGLVPSWAMERCQSEAGTAAMNANLAQLLRHAAHQIRLQAAQMADVRPLIAETLERVRRVSACAGVTTSPRTRTWAPSRRWSSASGCCGGRWTSTWCWRTILGHLGR
jgi:bleomycin hydrolase